MPDIHIISEINRVEEAITVQWRRVISPSLIVEMAQRQLCLRVRKHAQCFETQAVKSPGLIKSVCVRTNR